MKLEINHESFQYMSSAIEFKLYVQKLGYGAAIEYIYAPTSDMANRYKVTYYKGAE